MKRLLLKVAALCVSTSIILKTNHSNKSISKTFLFQMAIAVCKAESEMIGNETKMKFMQLRKMLDDVGKTINGQIDRVKLPISNIHKLGHCIHNHPFSVEDKFALEPFRQYMKTVYVAQDQIISWLSSFSPERHQRYSYIGNIPDYRLTDEERTAAANLMYNAIEEVKITSDSINEIFANPETKNNLDEMERSKSELDRLTKNLTESLEQTSDKDLAGKMMSESVMKIAKVSAKLVEMSESFEMLQMMEKIAQYVNDIAEAMKDFPLNLHMVYML